MIAVTFVYVDDLLDKIRRSLSWHEKQGMN